MTRKNRTGCNTPLLLAPLFLALLYSLLTGPSELERYPAPLNSPYRLPFPEDQSRLCIQGNRGIVSHRGKNEFSWDFAMPTGSNISAARAGVVLRVVQEHQGRGVSAPNNLVAIAHSDGSVASYLHIQHNGALVKPGQRVRQGQTIARSGNVGRSLVPHLHFHVRRANGDTIPLSFRELTQDRGIPRMFHRYRSENRPPLTRSKK